MSQQNAQFYAGLSQAGELARSGLDLEQQKLTLQRQGMDQQNAQFYVGVNQAWNLAQQGFSIEQQRVALQEKGMSQQDAQFYAGLAQAGDLARRGLDQDAIRIELQKQGMDQQNAQFLAAQVFEKEMFGLENKAGVQKALASEMISQIDPKDPQYAAKVNGVLASLGMAGTIDTSKLLAAPAPTTSSSGTISVAGQNTGVGAASPTDVISATAGAVASGAAYVYNKLFG